MSRTLACVEGAESGKPVKRAFRYPEFLGAFSETALWRKVLAAYRVAYRTANGKELEKKRVEQGPRSGITLTLVLPYLGAGHC